MNEEEGIDFRKLERELALAVEADEKYDRENSAKFRAVEQRVGSYEEFRDIVSAAHLKPLDRRDITGENSHKQTWNPHAQSKVVTNPPSSEQILPAILKTPGSAHEFTKVWKRQCKTDKEKYKLLLKIGGEELGRIFKAEICMGYLGEFLVILQSCLEDKDIIEVLYILEKLSKTNRFDLSVKFLSEKERSIASKLMQKLEDTLVATECSGQGTEHKGQYMKTFQEVRNSYGEAASS
ncbi:coiled-coil domain-containing protein 103-like [Montipora foliosa]|uniref:coiled-coil domain-containing protein 103-like n=1 Tax=Montipora foliosa TaxID=591990 RepID=UPI0035F19824